MLFRKPLTAAAIATSLAFGGVVAVPAMAQELGLPDAAPIDVTDEQISAFVQAALAVIAVQETYAALLAEAETEEEQQAILADADAAMVAAVEETAGITVDEYIAISQAAAMDPELDARINDAYLAAVNGNAAE